MQESPRSAGETADDLVNIAISFNRIMLSLGEDERNGNGVRFMLISVATQGICLNCGKLEHGTICRCDKDE